MLLRKLTCGQLTGVIFSNPLSTFFRARSRPTLQGESFHNPSFSLLSSLDQDVPGLTLTIIRSAFACPQYCVKVTDDRRPRISLLLLEHLNEITRGKMQAEIEEVKQYILQQARKVG